MINKRIMLLLAFIIISIILIAPNPLARGSIVTSSKVPQLSVGNIIYTINDEPANKAIGKDFSGNVKIETSTGTRYVKADGKLNVTLQDVQKTNLKFGLDINGGTRALVKVNSTEAIDQTIQTLQTRINLFGLRESSFRAIDKNFIEISIAGGTRDELSDLLSRQGKFEAKIPFAVRLSNGKGEITLDKKYEVTLEGDKVRIGDSIAGENETLEISTVKFTINKISKDINFTALVFTGNDIKIVFIDPQRSRIERAETGYRWQFSVQLSNEGAQRFAWVTKNVPSLIDYLESKIYLYLDDKLIDALNIASTLKGKVETEISITGGAPTQQDAVKEKAKIQSILRSGALPVAIEIAQLDTISPNLGQSFLYNALLAAGAAVIGVAAVVTARYKKPKLVFPMMTTSLSEVIIILGASALIGLTIDLPFIAGIIATIGTGIDAQIIILDQAMRKEERIETLHEKLARAFFIIFGSAGTVIAAMIPLLFLGFGLLRGFAIVTIIGVLSGILITRPAFGAIIEKLVKV